MSKAPSGGQVSYYLVHVAHPNRGGEPYDAECEDIIHALGMTFEEGCEFKAIWRTAKARLGDPKPGKDPLDAAIYDAEKRIHYAKLSLKQLLELKAQQEAEKSVTIAEAMQHIRMRPRPGLTALGGHD